MSNTLCEPGTAWRDLLAAYDGRERVPLHEVGEAVGMDRFARSYAVRSGVIRPTSRGGSGYVITGDDAVRIVFAAILAAAAGVAVVTILRGVVGAGLSPAVLAGAVAGAIPK
jgi:hypothetical protein